MRILRKQGVKDENPRFSAVVRLFRELRSGKLKSQRANLASGCFRLIWREFGEKVEDQVGLYRCFFQLRILFLRHTFQG